MRLPLWGARRRDAGPPPPLHPPGEAERLLRRLDFTVIRRLDGMRQGDHRNLAYGAGLDLAELREYQPGDDVRALDWNVTARMGHPYVRRYHEDREVTAWLALDLTASLDFGSGLQSKRGVLVDVAGTLARLLTARGDRVGALLYTGSREAPRVHEQGPSDEAAPYRPGVRLRRDEWWGQRKFEERERRPAELVVAGQGRDHVLHLLQRALAALQRVPPPDPARAPKERAGTHLETLLRQAFGTARQRSLILVLSDFLDEQELTAGEEDAPNSLAEQWYAHEATVQAVRGWARLSWTRALGALAQRHEVVGVWLRDPREEALPDVGVVTFQDAETGEQLVVDTSQPALRRAYADLAERRRLAMERAFARSGAALWPVNAAQPLVPALVQFLDQRRRTAIGVRRLMGRPA